MPTTPTGIPSVLRGVANFGAMPQNNVPGYGPDTNVVGDTSPGFLGNGQYSPNANNFTIPGYAGYQNLIGGLMGSSAGRAAPTLDPTQQGQFRGQQQDLASMLMAQANGQGPSLAQGQLQAATDRNLAQAYALSAANPNNGAAAREVANQRAAISQQAAADSGQLRLQEQMQARNQLGQLLAGARGQDIGLASENAQLQAGQNALNDRAVQFYLSQGLSLAQAQAQANMAYEQLRAQGFMGAAGNAIGGKILGGALSAGGALAGGYATGLGNSAGSP